MPEISAELVDKLASISAAINDFIAAVLETDAPLSDDIAAQVNERVRRGVCLQCQNPLEHEKRVTRGLCQTCYTKSAQRVQRGKTTWSWLVSNGFLLAEVSKGGRKSKRPDPVGQILSNHTDAQINAAEALAAKATTPGETPPAKKKKRAKR